MNYIDPSGMEKIMNYRGPTSFYGEFGQRFDEMGQGGGSGGGCGGGYWSIAYEFSWGTYVRPQIVSGVGIGEIETTTEIPDKYWVACLIRATYTPYRISPIEARLAVSNTHNEAMPRGGASAGARSAPSGGGDDLATLSFIAGAASLGYDSWQNLAYDGYNYIPSKGPNAGKPTSVWKMNKSGNFALKNGSKFPNSTNAASKLMATSIVKIGGIALTTVGLGFTVYDIRQNGLNLSNGTDFVMGGVAYVPGWGWAVSGGYFIGKACYEIYPSIPADYWGRPGTGFSR